MIKSGTKYIAAIMIVFGLSCANKTAENGKFEIAVTNSYLQCAVEDLCSSELEVLCIAPPGVCPGHFDMSPGQLKQLRNCRILLLFDFQKNVEQSLSRLKKSGLKVQLVKTQPGLCIPDTYLSTCQDVCRIISSEYPDKADQYQEALKLIRNRLDKLAQELREDIRQSGSKSAKVLASNHQADFVKWLGLDAIATFVGSDIETASNLNQCLEKAAGQDVKFVIANRQEGAGLAEALAKRLQAKAVVFSNFPEKALDGAGFDGLLRENVRALIEVAEQ